MIAAEIAQGTLQLDVNMHKETQTNLNKQIALHEERVKDLNAELTDLNELEELMQSIRREFVDTEDISADLRTWFSAVIERNKKQTSRIAELEKELGESERLRTDMIEQLKPIRLQLAQWSIDNFDLLPDTPYLEQSMIANILTGVRDVIGAFELKSNFDIRISAYEDQVEELMADAVDANDAVDAVPTNALQVPFVLPGFPLFGTHQAIGGVPTSPSIFIDPACSY
jgi:DNA repair exonuclease SbcCD ATPase subunit